MGFAADLNRVCKAAGDRAEQVVRKTAIELQNSMILMSPVDTGRFRANWQVGIDNFNMNTSAPPDPTGQAALGRMQAALATWEPGQMIILTNSLPYAQRLENGWSKQAPAGMVRLTVQQYGDYLKKVVSELP